MNRPLQLKLEVKKNRMRRRAGETLGEIARSISLTGAVVILTAALILGYDQILLSPHLRIKETVVKGCKELTEKDILSLADIRSPSNMLTINEEAITNRVMGNPWVRDVFIGREFPGRLVIWIRERSAVALIEKKEGFYLVDREGAAFKRLEAGEESDLPVLTGCIRDGVVDQEMVKKSLALLSDIEGIKDGPQIGAVSEIHGNETFGLALFTDTGLCLKLGFDGYQNKLRRLTPVMADLDRKNLKAGFLLIDLSNPAKINVQRRNIMEPAGAKRPEGAGKGFRM